MQQMPRLLQGCLLGVVVLCVGLATVVRANPQEYPQFAAQKVAAAIPIAFISAEHVKQQLDADAPQLLIDVRNRSSYDRMHLPGAVSMPLRELPQRVADIPRDTPVVLY